ncbi:MAG TPA: DUF6678 family protein [Tepidisphaeraceae bacterium]|nr:DUF6678 family protein [Tepidisphaeraceae bacterium]
MTSQPPRSSLPTAKSAQSPAERDHLRRVASNRSLCGLANDTKWDEFISEMRAPEEWRPSYRYKCIDGPPSAWDAEWFYHLPFPMVSVEWLDVAFLQERREHRLPPRITVTDHSAWLEDLLHEIGLDYEKGKTMIRIFGYSPKSLELFDEQPPSHT